MTITGRGRGGGGSKLLPRLANRVSVECVCRYGFIVLWLLRSTAGIRGEKVCSVL